MLAGRRGLQPGRVAVLLGVLLVGVWDGAGLGNVPVDLDHYRQGPGEVLTLRLVRLSLTGGQPGVDRGAGTRPVGRAGDR